jgi:hypothetical protein
MIEWKKIPKKILQFFLGFFNIFMQIEFFYKNYQIKILVDKYVSFDLF